MGVSKALSRFLTSRLWLAGVATVIVLLAALIVLFPTAPEIDREPVVNFHSKPMALDEVVSHPMRQLDRSRSDERAVRGAWLAGTIEEIADKPAVRVAEKLIEPTEVRRK